MKLYSFAFFYYILITVVEGGRGFVNNSKITDCSSDSCVDFCSLGRIRLLPGTEIKNDGRCHRVRCNEDFSLEITG
jgi:hypothetical protein